MWLWLAQQIRLLSEQECGWRTVCYNGGERVECQHAAKSYRNSLVGRIGWEIYARGKDGSDRDVVADRRAKVGLVPWLRLCMGGVRHA